MESLSTNIVDDQHHHDHHHHDQLISSFLEVAVGQTVETARNFLQTTHWNIEEAINLFLMNNTYHDSSMFYDNENRVAVSSSSDETWNDSTTSEDSRLSSLFRPPFDLLFEGSFQDAKTISVEKNLWSIVNLQSKTEFASHSLNRDVWSNKTVSELVESKFVLWQVYDRTVEGKKISSFYKIDSVPPVVLVIDPITGQKMHMWSGLIEAESFVEGLLRFTEAGPHEHVASLTRNRYPQTKETCWSRNNVTDQVISPSWGEEYEDEDKFSARNRTHQVVPPSWDEEYEMMETCSPSNNTNHIVIPACGPEFEEPKEVKEDETCLEYPVLTEEPKEECDRSIVCNLCIRFPDGRKKQRRFLKTEPVQLLWSFCYSHMEASERKVFKLVHAIPGDSKTLDYEANETFDQSGLANSMISVTWK